MPILKFDRSSHPESIVSALRRDGAAIVTGLANVEDVETVRSELRPELDASGLKTKSDFNGSKTPRISDVLSLAPSAAALGDHDMVVALVDEVPLPHYVTYQIIGLIAVEILPGEGA